MGFSGDGSVEVEVVVDGRDQVGEGPVWLGPERRLVWVDITGRLVHSLDPATGHKETVDVGQYVGAVVPRSSGGFVAAVETGFGVIDMRTGRLEMIAEVEADNPNNRMNDGKCDSAGRFWAGTMALDETPGAGALYRLDTDHTVTRVLENVTISNGLAWSLDDRNMYFVDTATNRVDILDYEPKTGAVRDRRGLIEIPPELGAPDGMTLDTEGHLWVALWGGSAVHRYAPNGTLDSVVNLPVSQVTSCAFGGEDLSELYITSATQGLAEGELHRQPHAGALFRCRPGAQGMPAYSFKD